MSVDPVSFIPPGATVNSLTQAADSAASQTKSVKGFESWLTEQVTELNQQIATADVNARNLATGEAHNLHEVMMSVEKAKKSFELLLQVRNKVMESYQEVMRMQI